MEGVITLQLLHIYRYAAISQDSATPDRRVYKSNTTNFQ